jgi:hypothetical protein
MYEDTQLQKGLVEHVKANGVQVPGGGFSYLFKSLVVGIQKCMKRYAYLRPMNKELVPRVP